MSQDQDSINWQEVSVHAKSYKEIYKLIIIEGSYYLSPFKQVDREYIHDLLSETKKILLCNI